ncbi:hypothetical protein [Serinicoccus sp. CNJ-927]|uniref:hypothetical protein n=1 Tax=Serinicoccus sp. CNJ-927 TaxID=1904970 RepID=UPI001EDC16F0|nr:hypothetical protein [Serinicoccus sp. CNJ-927]
MSLDLALERPGEAARQLLTAPLVLNATGWHRSVLVSEGACLGEVRRDVAVIRVGVAPPLELRAHGYPDELLDIQIGPGLDYAVYPAQPEARKFEHRYPEGRLCLEMPDDPADRRWHREYGLESLVITGARHMWYEEYRRRTGEWPVEDAPHGYPAPRPTKPNRKARRGRR